MNKAAKSGAFTEAKVSEIYPKVLSVSRATDIPAFHVGWLMDRLRQGFSEWQNPFNANQRQLVRFSEVRAIVFWSKNPAPLIPYLDEIADMGKNFYFQFTLNNYADTGLEPGVPELGRRIETLFRLAKHYPVVWRYDPVIVGDRLTLKLHLRNLERLMEALSGHTTKLVFSFVDIYGRVASNLGRINSEYRALVPGEVREFSERLVELRDKIAPGLCLATCAETDMDFASPGIQKNSCIDPELINRICGEEIYPRKLSLLGSSYQKDRGQRAECGCAPSKDIGSYRTHPCGHACRYCYAGHAGRNSQAQ